MEGLNLRSVKAAKKTTGMRREVSLALEELDQNFEDVEAYAVIFPSNENIVRASLNLLVAMFKAIENLIGYFIKNKGEILSLVVIC